MKSAGKSFPETTITFHHKSGEMTPLDKV